MNHVYKPVRPRTTPFPYARTPKHWGAYSDNIDKATTKALRTLLLTDGRIVGFSNEGDVVMVYLTEGGGWMFDTGAYTVSGRTESEVVANFKSDITREVLQ